MDNLVTINTSTTMHVKLRTPTTPNNNYNIKKKKKHPKTLITSKPPILKTTPQPCVPLPPLELQSSYDQSHAIPGRKYFSRYTSVPVQAFYENQRLRLFIEKLNKKDSDPVQILKDDGDWDDGLFWVVVKFLKSSSRSKEIPPVFHMWKRGDETRINESNYKKIISVLAEDGLMEESVLALEELKSYGLTPPLEVYNSLIHGFARISKFDDALIFLDEMVKSDLVPNSKTYNGLIQAYGHHGMYDEIGKCVNKMERDGFSLDSTTYNLLIREYSRGGLLKKMEKIYQIISSKRMELQSSTMVAMLDAYATFKLVEKMETFYRRVLNMKSAPLNDDLIRKLACIYIDNAMFIRLDELGLGLCSKNGMSDLVWCLRLLAPACHLSRQGMDFVLVEMEEAKVAWNVCYVNIMLLASLKMQNFKLMHKLLFELSARHVKPDLVTVGIIFDAISVGFDGKECLNTWERTGFLDKEVEMNTDPLVFTAFGKGHFLNCFERKYSSLDIEDRENETWIYQRVIDLVFEHEGKQLQP